MDPGPRPMTVGTSSSKDEPYSWKDADDFLFLFSPRFTLTHQPYIWTLNWTKERSMCNLFLKVWWILGFSNHFRVKKTIRATFSGMGLFLNLNTKFYEPVYVSVQFSSVAQSCPTLCNPMNRSTPGLPVHHQLPEFTQIRVHWVCDAIQPSHPLSAPSSPAPNPSQHQSLLQWVSSSHEVAKVLEFQL